ncbi:MAG: DedA family protein [Planctomycetaceae bacterium]|nr:DedA family protein [Planctomycetaceae bacterium]
MSELFDLFFRLDDVLKDVVSDYGVWTYAILFAIIFCETGLVVTPILPGDSLLFAVGAFAGQPESPLNIWVLIPLLFVAAVLGDTVNYHIGRYVGPKVFSGKVTRWLNQEHLRYTEQFFQRHGGKTIILARFLPIVRTFAPFVAGVGSMNYRRFLAYNVAGGALWAGGITLLGYYVGTWPLVQENFELVIVLIVILSIIPGTVTYLRNRTVKQPAAPEETVVS